MNQVIARRIAVALSALYWLLQSAVAYGIKAVMLIGEITAPSGAIVVTRRLLATSFVANAIVFVIILVLVHGRLPKTLQVAGFATYTAFFWLSYRYF